MMPNRCCIPDRRYRTLHAISLVLAQPHAEKSSLFSALNGLAEPPAPKRLRAPLRRVVRELKYGLSIAEAFSLHKKHFGSFFCQALIFGEQAVNPGVFFSRLAGYYEKNERYRKKIINTLTSPALILVVAAGILISLLAIIIPAAVQAALSFHGDVPAATRIVSHAFTLQSKVLVIPMVSVLILSVCFWHINTRYPLLENALALTPVIGNLFRKISLRRCALSFSLMLSNGASFAAASRAAAQTVRYTPFRMVLLGAAAENDENITASSSWLKYLRVMFPSSVLDTFLHEHDLPEAGKQLERIAEFYEEEIAAAVTAAALIIEPAIIAVTGLLGGGILAALYLPLL